jgi:hypothetical protein
MSESSRLDPDKEFPDDLTSVDRDDLDILNSRNHRSRDLQYIRDGEVDPETEGRHHELREELDRRQEARGQSSGNAAAREGMRAEAERA